MRRFLPHPANYWPFNLACLAFGVVTYTAVWFFASIWLGESNWTTIIALGGYAAGQLGSCIWMLRGR